MIVYGTAVLILLEIFIVVGSTPSPIRVVQCYTCQHFSEAGDCNTGRCTGNWCTASIVRDKNQGSVNVVKKCSQIHPNNETTDHCIQVNTEGVESIICGCNSAEFCNSESGIDNLLADKTTVFNDYSTGDEIRNVKCNLCTGDACDGNGEQCEGLWCSATIVLDKTTGTRNHTKACAPFDSGNGNGCLRTSEEIKDTITCSCNKKDFCTNTEDLYKLIDVNTNVITDVTLDDIFDDVPTTTSGSSWSLTSHNYENRREEQPEFVGNEIIISHTVPSEDYKTVVIEDITPPLNEDFLDDNRQNAVTKAAPTIRIFSGFLCCFYISIVCFCLKSVSS